MALDTLVRLPLVERPFALFADRVRQLRPNLTADDTAYVALAQHLGAPLVTRDRRPAAAAGTRCTITVLG